MLEVLVENKLKLIEKSEMMPIWHGRKVIQLLLIVYWTINNGKFMNVITEGKTTKLLGLTCFKIT